MQKNVREVRGEVNLIFIGQHGSVYVSKVNDIISLKRCDKKKKKFSQTLKSKVQFK